MKTKETTNTSKEGTNTATHNLTKNYSDRNMTLCSLMTQYNLSDSKRLTVCKYQGKVLVDIRYFIAEKATIKGVWISLAEWNNIVKYFSKIQKDVLNFI